jgi:hypothetical protein
MVVIDFLSLFFSSLVEIYIPIRSRGGGGGSMGIIQLQKGIRCVFFKKLNDHCVPVPILTR